MLSESLTDTSMNSGDINVFPGNWMPTMKADLAPYREACSVEVNRSNPQGANYTLAASSTCPILVQSVYDSS